MTLNHQPIRTSCLALLAGLSILSADTGRAWSSGRASAEVTADVYTSDQRECLSQLSPRASAPGTDIDARALVGLRDLATGGELGAHLHAIALSPDGSEIAFQMRRGDAARNRYCLGMFVMAIHHGARPRPIEIGGEPILASIPSGELASFPTGSFKEWEPKWSPDGQWVAFLKRVDGRTCVWRARADGSHSERVASLDTDIDDFAWDADGTAMIVASRPGLGEADREIEHEAATGYHYDARFFTLGSARPLAPAGPQPVVETIDITTHRSAPATAAQKLVLVGLVKGAPDNAHALSVRSDGATAWLAPGVEVSPSVSTVVARIAGRIWTCPAEACTGSIGDLFWSRDRTSLLFSRYDAQTGLQSFYRWHPLKRAATRLFLEDARYSSCVAGAAHLFCVREAPTSPRAIVELEPTTGHYQLLFDPNPEITGQFHGRVERLTWKDQAGDQTFGHLTLPPDAKPGLRLPLVVVQYRAAGFQRGGVGDEAPILPLANAGIAVLNIERQEFGGHYTSVDAYMRAAMTDWADEHRSLALVESGVKSVIAQGLIDRQRVGIHGMSAGAQTAQFALIHSHMFAAVSLSTCCKDPVGTMVEAGPGMRATEQQWGLAPLDDGNRAQWRAVSLAMNADTIRTPILMQLPAWEFRAALETQAAFAARQRPLDLYVFADEYHVKSGPAHRLAIYQRNIDWFAFWLRDRDDPDPGKVAQYAHWHQWRDQLRASTP